MLLSTLLLGATLSLTPGWEPEDARHPKAWWKRCASRVVLAERPQPALVTQDGKWLPIPYGLEEEALVSTTLGVFQAHSSVIAVIYHGSRTHFEYGYLPSPSSDLDVLVLYEGDPTPELGEPLRDLLKTDFPVNASFRPTPDLAKAIQSRMFQFPLNEAEDRALHDLAYRNAASRWVRDGDWKASWQSLAAEFNPPTLQDRIAMGHVGQAAMFLPPPVLLALGKQAVILIRHTVDTPIILRLLRENGFSNLGVVYKNEEGAEVLTIPGHVPRARDESEILN